MSVLPKQKTRIIKKFSYFLNNLKYKNSQIINNIFLFLFKFLLIKKILNFYFRFKFQVRYQESKLIDTILDNIINKQIISEIIEEEYELILILNSGTKLIFWNSNKPHSWISRGRLINHNNKIIYSWESKMPSAYMMWKFDKFLEVEKLKFIISEI